MVGRALVERPKAVVVDVVTDSELPGGFRVPGSVVGRLERRDLLHVVDVEVGLRVEADADGVGAGAHLLVLEVADVDRAEADLEEGGADEVEGVCVRQRREGGDVDVRPEVPGVLLLLFALVDVRLGLQAVLDLVSRCEGLEGKEDAAVSLREAENEGLGRLDVARDEQVEARFVLEPGGHEVVDDRCGMRVVCMLGAGVDSLVFVWMSEGVRVGCVYDSHMRVCAALFCVC